MSADTQGRTAQHDGSALLFGALAGVAALVAVGALLFEMRWDSNDDIAMAMVVHGYGIAAVPSPNLFFSNQLWGHLAQLLDVSSVIPGYSLASLATLTVAGAGMFVCLARNGVPRLVCAAAVALILARPLLFQQFTVNAGLVTIVALLCWQHAARHGRRTALYCGCGLLFIAFLIRAPEACLVVMVALPLLPWSTLARDRHARIAIVALAFALLAAQVIDHRAYQAPAWQAFTTLNPLRAIFTDFGARQAARSNPQLVREHGYSANDMELMGNWFFVDPDIADPKRLRPLLASFGSAPLVLHSFTLATRGIHNLWHPELVILFAAAVLVGLIQGGRRVAASWALMLGAIALLSIAGRSGPLLRIYVPLLSVLVIAPLVCSRLRQQRTAVVLTILIGAAAVNGSHVIKQSLGKQQQAAKLQHDLAALTTQPVALWGASFPFELVYPVLGPTPITRGYRFYGLGVFTLAPFSVAYAQEAAGDGFIARLRSDEGSHLIAIERQVALLATYCQEHLGGQLESLSTPPLGTLPMSRQRCTRADDRRATPR